MRRLFLSFKPPEELKRYENIKLYPEHDDDTPDIVDTGVDTIGNVSLDKDELSVLRLPPDFAVLGRLSEEEFMVEVEKAMTKLRWEKRKIYCVWSPHTTPVITMIQKLN